MITSPAHALELLGGTKAVADRVDRPLTTVSSWAARQSIPIEWWADLIAFAAERGIEGVDYATLAQAHAAEKARRGGAAEAATATEPEGVSP